MQDMIISNGILLSVSNDDLTADGALCVPDGVRRIGARVGCDMPRMRALALPDTLKAIGNGAFCYNHNLESIKFGAGVKKIPNGALVGGSFLRTITIPRTWTNLDNTVEHLLADKCTVVRDMGNDTLQTFPLFRHGDRFFYEQSRRDICGITIYNLLLPRFDDNGISGAARVAVHTGRSTFIEPTLDAAMDDARRKKIMNEFQYALWKNRVQRTKKTKFDEDIDDVILGAAYRTLHGQSRVNAATRAMMRGWADRIPQMSADIMAFIKKYPLRRDLYELHGVDFDKMMQIVAPMARGAMTKSATRRLKHAPVDAAEMNAMALVGYQNPGAFPYEWLQQIPRDKRGATTARLHKIFKNAAIKSYCADTPDACNRMMPAMDDLEQKMSRVLKQPVDIMYVGGGCFGKTHMIFVGDAPAHILKTYHSDCEHGFFATWAHDTELQNSFLLSGRKYYGDLHWRQIETAGISIQRGERYLICKLAEGMRDVLPKPPYEQFKWYNVYDHSDNLIGNTLIDCGALEIVPQFQTKPYMRKIINTVLYRPFNELNMIQKKYNAEQIRTAVEFINARMTHDTVKRDEICRKLQFLSQHVK